jgi:hypothetical protein
VAQKHPLTLEALDSAAQCNPSIVCKLHYRRAKAPDYRVISMVHNIKEREFARQQRFNEGLSKNAR